MDPKGYYTILGLSSNATMAEINRAYKLLALKYHPDRNKSAFSHSTMVRLNAAYEVLSVPDRKYLYDIGEPLDDIYNKSHSTKYKSSSEPDTGDSPWKWYTFLVIALLLIGVTYVAISIYQAQFGPHYWLTLKVQHFYTTIGSQGSDSDSDTTEVHVVGIDNQSRTHDVRIEVLNGEQAIDLQDEIYQSDIGKKESYWCLTYNLFQEDCSTLPTWFPT